MTVCDRLYESVRDIWEGYHNHPFITELGAGTLDPAKFRYYMIQDCKNEIYDVFIGISENIL